MEAVKLNGLVLEYASEVLQNDKEIVMEATHWAREEEGSKGRSVNGSEEEEEVSSSSFRTCDGALGTACSVTCTYGMVAASQVVEMIALNKFVVPKKQGIIN